MPCYKPLEAWHGQEVNPSGKRSIVFDKSRAIFPGNPLSIPCGQCVGCRLERSRQWAIRCVHEASLYEDNCFITLTFNDEALAKRKPRLTTGEPGSPLSLDKTEYQKFMKRLRKKLNGKRVRYFQCGEYGEQFGRPHYHAILFGYDFPDKELFRITPTGERLFRSAMLEKLWPFGFSSIGSVTFESAAYVARYVMKKATGDLKRDRYMGADVETGELVNILEPEYCTMSRRPGIAADWFEQYQDDLYPKDFITVRGKKMSVPKYYDRLLEQKRPYEMEQIKALRVAEAKKHADNNTPERLAVRQEVQERKLKKLPRNLENGHS